MGTRNLKMKKFIFALFILTLFIGANVCLAANLGDAFKVNGDKDPLKAAAGAGAGFDLNVTFDSLAGAVLTSALSLMGVVFLILAIYAGYNWMTARGNEEMVTKAKSTLINSIIGLVIVLSAYAITYFVLSQISNQALKGS
ncbi:hypothetical protein HY797_04375 [Candidatus Falkowbacteria bacterium]|nr:hypothetical protein [Candidatus Falkowbacteria bacterium]